MVVVLVEVVRKAYLASIVPVIVNAILNEHQLIVDIVAFVAQGDFPRSRLGEKQRGKILASWVTRKLRTIAQFMIRDPDANDGGITAVPEGRRPESMRGGTSIRESVLREQFANGAASIQHEPIYESGDAPQDMRINIPDSSLPEGVAEMPAIEPYESSITASPPYENPPLRSGEDTTPTAQQGFALPQMEFGNNDYFGQPDSSLHDPEATPQPSAAQHFEFDESAAPEVVVGDASGGIGQAVTGNGGVTQHNWYGVQGNGRTSQGYMPYRPGGTGGTKSYSGQGDDNALGRQRTNDSIQPDWAR